MFGFVVTGMFIIMMVFLMMCYLSRDDVNRGKNYAIILLSGGVGSSFLMINYFLMTEPTNIFAIKINLLIMAVFGYFLYKITKKNKKNDENKMGLYVNISEGR